MINSISLSSKSPNNTRNNQPQEPTKHKYLNCTNIIWENIQTYLSSQLVYECAKDCEEVELE